MPTKTLGRLAIAGTIATAIAAIIALIIRSSIPDPLNSRPLLGLTFAGYLVEDGKQVAVFNVTNHENAALHFQGCTVDICSNGVWTTMPYSNNNYFQSLISTAEEAKLWYTGENSLYPHRMGKIHFPSDQLPDADARRVSTNQVWRLRLMCARQLIGFQLLPLKLKNAKLSQIPKLILEKNTLGFSYSVDILSEEIPLK